MKLICSIILLAAIAASAAPNRHDTRDFTIKSSVVEGTLVTSRGELIGLAKLELRQDKKIIARAQSDSQGKFTFGNVLAGTYLIRIPDYWCRPQILDEKTMKIEVTACHPIKDETVE